MTKKHIGLSAITLSIFFVISCKPKMEEAVTSAFHKDQNTGELGLADVGIYVNNIPTTTRGEIHSEEFSKRHWSGDKMIHRNSKSYNRALHNSISSHGLFYYKGKTLKPNVLSAIPSRITVKEGVIVPDPDGCSKIPGAKEISGESSYTSIYYKNQKLQDSTKFTLCIVDDTKVRRGSSHKANMKVLVFPVSPSSNGTIHLEVQWPKLDEKNSAIFNIKAINLVDRNFEKEQQEALEEVKVVPEYLKCESITTCTDAPEKEQEMKMLCEEMNQLIDPIYTERHITNVDGWFSREKKLKEISSGCHVEVFLATSHAGVAQPSIFSHTSHGLSAYLKNIKLNSDFADLRFAKALTKAMKSLKDEFNIAGFRYSGIYSYRNIINDSGSTKRLSRHANGMAIDISSFTTKEGETLNVTQYHSKPILKQIKNHFCKFFRVVLGPEYNQVHHNHFHLALHPTVKTEYDEDQPEFSSLIPNPYSAVALAGNDNVKGEMMHEPIDPMLDQHNPNQLPQMSLTGSSINTFCR